MKVLINDKVVTLPDMPPIEFTIAPEEYGYYVAQEIHKCYSVDDEIAIIRQKDKKPEEYETYYNYCEACKAKIKDLIKEV